MNNFIKVFNKTISQKKKKKKKNFFNDSIAYTFVYNKDKRDVKIGTLFPTVIEKKRGKKPCWVE